MLAKARIKFLLVFVLIVSILGSSACWSRREMESVAYILVLGVDSTPGGNVKIFAQVGLPSADPAGAGGEGPVIQTISSQGRDISEALDNMYLQTTKSPNLNHLRLVIIQENLAREGLWHMLDFLRRNVEVRLNVLAAITSEDMEKLLGVEDPLSTQPALAIFSQFNLNAQRSRVPQSELMKLISQILEPDLQAVLPIIETGEDRFTLGKTAVFDGEEMKTDLDEDETLGLLLWRDQVRGGVVTVPQGEKDVASFRILSSSTETHLNWDGERLHVQVTVKPEVDIVELHGKDLSDLENSADHYFINRMADTLEVAKEEGIDFLGLSALLRRKNPQVWHSIKDNWDEVLLNAEYDLRGNVHIRGQGEIR